MPENETTTKPERTFDPHNFVHMHGTKYAEFTFKNDGNIRPIMWLHTYNITKAREALQSMNMERMFGPEDTDAPEGMVVCFPVDLEDGYQKDQLIRGMTKLAEQIEADMFMFVTEVWMAHSEKAPDGTIDTRQPSERPDRREAVMVTLEIPGEQHMFMAPIVRPADAKPYLEPFTNRITKLFEDVIEEGELAEANDATVDATKFQGRFMGLLPENRELNTVVGDATGWDETRAENERIRQANNVKPEGMSDEEFNQRELARVSQEFIQQEFTNRG